MYVYMQINISIRDLFTYTTIEALAKYVSTLEQSQELPKILCILPTTCVCHPH